MKAKSTLCSLETQFHLIFSVIQEGEKNLFRFHTILQDSNLPIMWIFTYEIHGNLAAQSTYSMLHATFTVHSLQMC